MVGQRYVVGLTRLAISGHQPAEGAVDALLQRPHRSPAAGQLFECDPLSLQRFLDLLVKHHVGAAKSVDRLLRVAYQEELSGCRGCTRPVCYLRIASGEQEENLDLQRIRVLKLIDEDVSEPTLQVAAHLSVVANQIAGTDQQVEKVELSGVALEATIRFDDFAQLAAQ